MVLCAPASAVPGVVKERLSSKEVVIRYVYHKVEHVQTFSFKETFESHRVSLFTLSNAASPCLFPLPHPFNSTLWYGTSLLFQMEGQQDFTQMWNEACVASLTWQHNRPKKTDDPLQKLGLPPRLNDYLKDQLIANGLDIPVLSDDETLDHVDVLNEEKESVYETSSDSESEATSIEYYTEDDDAEEEEEEDEQEPEPEEIDDGEENE